MNLIPLSFHSTDTSSLGRLDYDSMSQQALMEMCFSGLHDQGTFLDANGNFKDACDWHGVICNANAEVTDIRMQRDEAADAQGGTFHFQFLPQTLKGLTFSRFSASGSIDLGLLPPGLELLFCWGNSLTGIR